VEATLLLGVAFFVFMIDLYWVANYEDGNKLEQFSPEGKERRYADIGRDKLTRFDMVEKKTAKAIFSVYLRQGQRLIYRRRSLINMNGGERVIVYLVGWQMTVMTNSGPRNITAINYIHQDGSIALDDSRDNLELLDFER
jgi:hypothetical protein